MSYTLKRSHIPMLPEGQPHPEHHLGGAKDPHPVRLLHEPHPDPAGALGTDHPQPRMPLWSQEFYEPIPNREYGECLYRRMPRTRGPAGSIGAAGRRTKDTPPGGRGNPSCPWQSAGNANEQEITHLGDASSARGLLPFAYSGPGGGK
jgi:hypothetical protein